jgi:hypothetical protein
MYVNPQIVRASADIIRHEEGSVSMPGVTEEIERHARVRMSYQDLSGVEKVEEADGLLSVSPSLRIPGRISRRSVSSGVRTLRNYPGSGL